jgi:hypothetical protein
MIFLLCMRNELAVDVVRNLFNECQSDFLDGLRLQRRE